MTKFAARKTDALDTVSCNGANHRDRGRRGHCLECGREVVKREDGRIYDVRRAVSEAGYERFFYRCYERTHACDPTEAARYEEARQRDLDAGLIVHGQHVTVVRGRKVPKGTAGKVFYIARDEDFHGREYLRVGFRTDDGKSFFVNSAYLQATSKL